MWQEEDNKVVKEIAFINFVMAFSFMILLEKMGHPPDWCNIIIRSRSHNAGKVITEKDHILATAIDKVYREI